MFKFIKSVNQTMAKVSWPTWKQNRRDTGVVIISSILFARPTNNRIPRLNAAR